MLRCLPRQPLSHRRLPTPTDYSVAVLDLAAEACARGSFRDLLQHNFEDIFAALVRTGILRTFHETHGADISSWATIMTGYANKFMADRLVDLENAGYLDALDVPDVRGILLLRRPCQWAASHTVPLPRSWRT